MRTEIDAFEIIERTVTPPGQTPRRLRGIAIGGLIRELQKCPPDAIAGFAFIDPMGNSVMTSVNAVIHDYDGTGAMVVLCDPNIAKQIKVQVTG